LNALTKEFARGGKDFTGHRIKGSVAEIGRTHKNNRTQAPPPMPCTLLVTDGVLPAGTEKIAIARITDAMLKWHQLTGNRVMTPNVTAQVHVLPRGTTFSGGKEFSGAWVEWKVPSFAFTDRKVQQGFFQETTDILYELAGGKLPKDNIYVNVVHTVDGAWNFNGRAMTNSEIIEAVGRG
jgi:hypothetical protein